MAIQDIWPHENKFAQNIKRKHGNIITCWRSCKISHSLNICLLLWLIIGFTYISEWRLAFRSTTNTNVPIYETWTTSGDLNNEDCSLWNTDSTIPGVMKSDSIDNWESVAPAKVSILKKKIMFRHLNTMIQVNSPKGFKRLFYLVFFIFSPQTPHVNITCIDTMLYICYYFIVIVIFYLVFTVRTSSFELFVRLLCAVADPRGGGGVRGVRTPPEIPGKKFLHMEK